MIQIRGQSIWKGFGVLSNVEQVMNEIAGTDDSEIRRGGFVLAISGRQCHHLVEEGGLNRLSETMGDN